MSVEYVEKYSEEMCDICHEFDYGVYVNIHHKRICEKCCQSITKQLKVYKIENE